MEGGNSKQEDANSSPATATTGKEKKERERERERERGCERRTSLQFFDIDSSSDFVTRQEYDSLEPRQTCM